VTEARAIAGHAGTVLAGQLAVMAFAVTDSIVAGRHSEAALAALALGSSTYITVFISLMGVLQALLPLWSEMHGAGQPDTLGASVRQSLYLWLVLAVAGCLMLAFPGPLFALTDVPPDMQDELRAYLRVLILVLPLSMLFRIFSTLSQSLGKPRLVTWIQIGALAPKVLLSTWLVHGGLGLAPLGVQGCAWATLIVTLGMAGTAVWLLRTDAVYAPLNLWRRIERPQMEALARLLRLGIPAGLTIMVEVSSFTLLALLMARLGTVAVAGHQIAASVTAVLYMAPLSLAIATSARASFWLGRRDATRARQAVQSGLRLTLAVALTGAMALWLLRGPIARLYTPSPEVAALGALLLGWVAVYHLADALQAVMVFVLRSFGVTVAPLVIYSVLLWAGGLGGGFWLTYHGLGPVAAVRDASAFWMTSAIALWMAAALLGLRLRRALAHPLTHP